MTCPQLQAKLNILKSARTLLAQYDATNTNKAATAEMRVMTEEWEVVLDELAEHFWQEKIIKSEKEALEKYFDQPIEVPKLPAEVTKAKLEFWKQNQFALHYSPGLEIPQDNTFPGQKKKIDADVYKWIKEKEINSDTIKLPKGWILIDTRPKPQYNNGDQMYENDILGPVLEKLRKENHIENFKHEDSRFNISNDELQKPEVKAAIAEVLKVRADQLSLPLTALWNYLGNAFYPEWGDTNTWEWFEDEYKGGYRLYGGLSNHDGLSYVGCDSSGDRDASIGFRPLVVFS